MKGSIAQTSRGFVGRKRERDLHISVVAQLGPFNRPFRSPREARGRAGLPIAARAEPRENDGHAAANRLAGCEQTLGAYKQDRPLPAWRPMSDMSTLQIEIRFCCWRRNRCAH